MISWGSSLKGWLLDGWTSCVWDTIIMMCCVLCCVLRVFLRNSFNCYRSSTRERETGERVLSTSLINWKAAPLLSVYYGVWMMDGSGPRDAIASEWDEGGGRRPKCVILRFPIILPFDVTASFRRNENIYFVRLPILGSFFDLPSFSSLSHKLAQNKIFRFKTHQTTPNTNTHHTHNGRSTPGNLRPIHGNGS